MIKPNLEYLAFDDRKLILIGVPVLGAIIPLTFWGLDLQAIADNGIFEYVESMTYSLFYWLTCRYIIIELRKRIKPLSQTRKRLFLQVLIVAPIIPVSGIMIGSIFGSIQGVLGIDDAYEPSGTQAFLSTGFISLTCFLLYEAIYFIHKYQQAIMEKNQLELAHVQGQLENLRNQINPHFLFNSLNTLMNLIPVNPERAMNYLDRLSKFYRYAVSNQKQILTPLSTELEIANIYAELLSERFQEAIIINLPDQDFDQAQILPLSLQLLIENAVKHNIVSTKRPLIIEVKLDMEKQYLWVNNNIQKKIQEVSSTGMGLKNIKKRFSFFTEQPVEVKEDSGQFCVGLPFIYGQKGLEMISKQLPYSKSNQ